MPACREKDVMIYYQLIVLPVKFLPRPVGAMAAIACGALSSLALAPASTEASVHARSFVCSTSAGAPSTNVVTQSGQQVPLIRWTSAVFNDAGWTPERRCQEVSGRFDTYFKQGRLDFITTGRMNGLPVICTARNHGGACDGLLFTLKPGQNATHTLQELFSIRTKARGPLNETNSRVYVSLDELVSNAQANTSAAPASATGPRLF